VRCVAHMGEKRDIYRDFVGKCKGNKISFWVNLAIDVEIILQYSKEIGCQWT